MRSILMAAGLVGVLIGLLWVGQGSGWFPYPRSSFMIDQRPWIFWGIGIATLGAVAMVVSRSIRRS